MRNEQHYRQMLEENPNAWINFSLAASMVYAARYGICEPEHRDEEWSDLARRLKATYGETLDHDQVVREMDLARQELDSLDVLAARSGLNQTALAGSGGCALHTSRDR